MSRMISYRVSVARVVLAASFLILSSGLPSTAQPPAGPNPLPANTAQPHPDSIGDEDTSDGPNAALRSGERASRIRRQRQAGFTPAELATIKDNCAFGMPKTEGDLGPTRHVVRRGYVLEHSSLDKIPIWVCEHSTKAELAGNIPRRNPFKSDPILQGHPRAELSDYKRSGYDRGHMAPAGNQTVEQDLKDETFFLSNMTPQIGPTFNQGIWAQLEDEVRNWTTALGETWIITGPMFYDPLEEDANTADGIIPYDKIGDGDVAVPTHCYKIVLAKSAAGKWQSIAFVLENRRYGQPYRLKNYIVTVDWLEERTGLNFFPDIVAETGDPELERNLESTKSEFWQ